MHFSLACLCGAQDATHLMTCATTASQVAAEWLMNLDAALSLLRLQPCPLIDPLHSMRLAMTAESTSKAHAKVLQDLTDALHPRRFYSVAVNRMHEQLYKSAGTSTASAGVNCFAKQPGFIEPSQIWLWTSDCLQTMRSHPIL